MLHCVLNSAAYPEYGQVTIPFPIPVIEYEYILGCLVAMELGARLKRDCRVDELGSGFLILKRLGKVGANLDEPDYLVRRLDSFDGYEAAQFQAIAVRLGTSDMTGFINPILYCQRTIVIANFSDLEGIGKMYVLAISGGCLYANEQEQVDDRTETLKLILNEHGTVTPYGMVYDNGMEPEQFYTGGGPFPGYFDREFIILLEISPSKGQSTLLILPDNPARLECFLCRTDIQDSPQMHPGVADSTLPDEVIRSIPTERLPINDPNRLCRATERIALKNLETLIQLLTDRNQPSQRPSPGRLSI